MITWKLRSWIINLIINLCNENKKSMVFIYTNIITRVIHLWWCNMSRNIKYFWTFASQRGPMHYWKLWNKVYIMLWCSPYQIPQLHNHLKNKLCQSTGHNSKILSLRKPIQWLILLKICILRKTVQQLQNIGSNSTSKLMFCSHFKISRLSLKGESFMHKNPSSNFAYIFERMVLYFSDSNKLFTSSQLHRNRIIRANM